MVTSAKVKNDWNKKNYDRISVYVPKGERERYKEFADKHGMSLNTMINNAVNDLIVKLDAEEEQ